MRLLLALCLLLIPHFVDGSCVYPRGDDCLPTLRYAYQASSQVFVGITGTTVTTDPCGEMIRIQPKHVFKGTLVVDEWVSISRLLPVGCMSARDIGPLDMYVAFAHYPIWPTRRRRYNPDCEPRGALFRYFSDKVESGYVYRDYCGTTATGAMDSVVAELDELARWHSPEAIASRSDLVVELRIDRFSERRDGYGGRGVSAWVLRTLRGSDPGPAITFYEVSPKALGKLRTLPTFETGERCFAFLVRGEDEIWSATPDVGCYARWVRRDSDVVVTCEYGQREAEQERISVDAFLDSVSQARALSRQGR